MVNKIVITHIHTSWNFCTFLLFLKKNDYQKIIVLLESDVKILKFLTKNHEKSTFDFITINNKIKKVKVFFDLKSYCKNNIVHFVKFSNFSFFGQLLQKYLNLKKTIFIDDGTTFINLLDDKIEYSSNLRKFFKEFFWSEKFTPRFNNFNCVDVAYLTFYSLVKKHLSAYQTNFLDFGEIFSYEKLDKISKVYFNLKKEKSFWDNQLKKSKKLFLGSSLVEHGFFNKDEYLNLVTSNISFNFDKTVIYKPHPNEFLISKELMTKLNYRKFSNLPVELFILKNAPKEIISFGSTSGFLIYYSKLNLKSRILLPSKIFSKKLVNSINQLNDSRLIINLI